MIKVQKLLKELGYSKEKSSFSRISSDTGLTNTLTLAKSKSGVDVLLSVGVFGSSGGQFISPGEIQRLTPSGDFYHPPHMFFEPELSWPRASESELCEVIRERHDEMFSIRADASLMLPIIEHLIGMVPNPGLLRRFPGLIDAKIRATRPRSQSRAAYCVLAGRFEDALAYASSLPIDMRDAIDVAIIQACHYRHAHFVE